MYDFIRIHNYLMYLYGTIITNSIIIHLSTRERLWLYNDADANMKDINPTLC